MSPAGKIYRAVIIITPATYNNLEEEQSAIILENSAPMHSETKLSWLTGHWLVHMPVCWKTPR